MNQIELHHQIRVILSKNPFDCKKPEVLSLISINTDARQYFYFFADERWLDWFWKEGFFEVITTKADDATSYEYRMSVLQYLVRISEKAPGKVVDIIRAIPISDKTVNTDVVDRFLWICKILPAEHLAQIVEKIRDDRWIPLMGSANRWFEYEKMFKVLSEAKDCKSILVLAEALLEVRSREEIEKDSSGIRKDNPFYFSELAKTKIFTFLANMEDDAHTEEALGLAIKVLAKITQLGCKAGQKDIFPLVDIIPFYEVDFFTLELGRGRHLSRREDVIELVALIKTLLSRLIKGRCDENNIIRRFYTVYVDSLPQTQVMWRFRLFVLSLCPKAYNEELKKAFFKLFETKRYSELLTGAEYKQALRSSFSSLLETDKREYVSKVITYFQEQSENNEDEEWHMAHGSQILSMIWHVLTKEEQEKAESAGFVYDSKYKPGPRIGESWGGRVCPRGPIKQDELEKLLVPDIAKKLRNDWAPKKLREQNTNDDFLTPVNAEGVSELLKGDIPKRLQEYINNAGLFFERDVLDPQYTYAFLNGIRETIPKNRTETNNVNWQGLFSLLVDIKKSAENKSFEIKEQKEDSIGWVVGWDSVHSALTDLVKELLTEKDGRMCIVFTESHDQLFEIIKYLLNYPDPTPEDEKVETAKLKSKSPNDEDFTVSDPLTTAINSVRGRAFEAFVYFTYQDGKKFGKDNKVRISPDIKKLYEEVLKRENTRALMFMFGHYLPTFYFRDVVWIKSLLPIIFPTAQDKKHLYLAAWEGYLATNLYGEIFFDPDFQELYERGLTLSGNEDPGRKYFKNPDEGIAIHFALAFIHFKEFGLDHPLFIKFWEVADPKQHTVFISFIGRTFVSNANEDNSLLEKEPKTKERLKDFWDWLINNYKEPKPFTEFGFWINLEKPVFDPHWLAVRIRKTLEVTKGVLDWDYGITEGISQLAKEAPEDTLAIAHLLFLEGSVRNVERRGAFFWDDKCFEVLKILYANPSTKAGAYTLIDDLIREGGSIFWKLEEIVGNLTETSS